MAQFWMRCLAGRRRDQLEETAVSIDQPRKEHARSCLVEADMDPDPIRQFALWFDEAQESGNAEFNAMTLATATPEGPPVRADGACLRGIDERGFSFFTNYESRKAHELEANPFAALVFFWHELERQVRIEGRVERTSAEESDRYFHSRPRGARIGAWASPQSQVIAGREVLEARFVQFETQHPGEMSPGRPTGAAIASYLIRSNSGRAVSTGCTTGYAILVTQPEPG